MNCRQNPNICTGGSYCYNGYCVCPEGYEEKGGECVIPKIFVDPGQSCDRPVNSIAIVECTGNSVCANGFCVCPNGEPIQNNMCTTVNSVAAPGEQCIPNITRCTGSATCLNGVCTCPGQQVAVNGQCALVSLVTQMPTQPCSPQTICLGNSYCVAGRCQCLPNTSLSRTGTICQPVYIVPSPYITTTQQQQQGGGTPGTACVYNPATGAVQLCQGGSACSKATGMCVCVNGQTIYDTRCVPTPYVAARYANPGESCTQPGTYCQGGARCVQGLCACDAGFTPSKNAICVPYVVQPGGGGGGILPTPPPPPNSIVMPPFPSGLVPLRPGESCDQHCAYTGTCSQACAGGSVCADGVCTCPQGQYALDGQCTPYPVTTRPSVQPSPPPPPPPQTTGTSPSTSTKQRRRPSEPCDYTTLCMGGSSCVLGVCQCPPGYTASYDKESCISGLLLQPQASPPGGAESRSPSARPPTAGEGKSPSSSSTTNPSRRSLIQLGHKCSDSKACVSGAECLWSVCACPPHTVGTDKGECVPEEGEGGVEMGALFTHQWRSSPTATTKAEGGGILPGMPCSLNDGDANCLYGSTCVEVAEKPSTTGEWIRQRKSPSTSSSSFCVCDHHQVTNSMGHCTSRLLADALPILAGAPCSIGGDDDDYDYQEEGGDPWKGDCQKGSTCLGGRCVCTSGKVNNGKGECILKATSTSTSTSTSSAEEYLQSTRQDAAPGLAPTKKGIGEKCLAHRECEVPALCLDRICRCTEGGEKCPPPAGANAKNPTINNTQGGTQLQY